MIFNTHILDMQSKLVQETQEILKIKSVERPAKDDMPFGEDVHKCFLHTLKLAESLGFKTKNIDNYAGHAEIGSGEEIVGILVHLDVVPEGDDWDYDPYGGEIVEGRIYGRGALDDKGPAIACLFAMKALVDSGVELKKRVRLIFGLNEETHWKGIRHYLMHEEAPSLGFTPDSDFPACHGEKGIMMVTGKKTLQGTNQGLYIKSFKGGHAANMVPDEAKVILSQALDLSNLASKYSHAWTYETKNHETHITAKGISAHGSTPEKGLNAISILMELLNQIDIEHKDQADFVKFYNQTIAYDFNGVLAGCNFEDEDSGKLTYNVGLINLDENHVEMVTNLRYPITSDFKAVVESLKNQYQEIKIDYQLDDHMPPIYFPKDHPLIEKLMKVYQDHTGDMSPASTTGGGTYARACDNIVAFGGVFPGHPELAHQKNEYIEIKNLIKTAQIYASAIYELAKED